MKRQAASLFYIKDFLETFQTKEDGFLDLPKLDLPETTASDPSKFLP